MKYSLSACLLCLCMCFFGAIHAQDDLNFMFSPNRVKDVCSLQVNQRVKVEIIDLRGEVVFYRAQFESGEFDLKHLSSGIYFLRISSAKDIQTQRLVRS